MVQKRFLSILISIISLFLSLDVMSQSRLWGTTTAGFESGSGGIFSISADGKYFETIHYFGENPGYGPMFCDILHASDGKKYGMTVYGGPFDAGVIFQYDTAGNKYKAVHFFNKTNGAEPYGSLIQAKNGRFYGMTAFGGKYNQGVLFSYQPDSSSYKVLHHFKDTISGKNPYGDLIQATNGLLYGMTSAGGIYNKGVIFSYNIAKDTFIRRFSFNDTLGAEPTGTLTQVGGKFYGVTRQGGTNTGKGAIFSIDTSNYKVTRYYSFGSSTGESPMGKLVMANNGRLYGVASTGGQSPGLYPGTSGSVFSIDTSSHTFAVIKQFSGYASIVRPIGSLLKLSNGKLYGTCSDHINNPNQGGIFSIRTTSSYNMEKSFSNSEPASVASPLSVLAPGKLIGLAYRGGEHINRGVIYTFDTSSKAVKNLIEFNTAFGGKNSNGFLTPAANGLLYGTTIEGGKDKTGVLYSLNPKTNEKKVLYDFIFSGSNGLNPRTKLVQTADGKLWGVTARGGSYGDGTIFSFDTSKKTIAWEYEFNGSSDGKVPMGNFIIDSKGLLYGTTFQGGANNSGIIYSFNPSTKVFSKLGDFKDTVSGSNPTGQLNLTKQGIIIGLTNYGGKYQGGTIFNFNPKDTTLKIVANLKDSLGVIPGGGLTLAKDGLYYGMAQYGGDYNFGTIFSYNDSSHRVIHMFSFEDTSSGSYPVGNLSQFSNGLLYGMAGSGGKHYAGTIFSFSPDSSHFVKLLDFDKYNGASPGYGELTEVFTEPNRWTGKKDSLWSNRENWSNGKLPSEAPESRIPSKVKRFPFINKHETAVNLSIDTGAQVTIGSGVSLTANDRFLNNGTLIILNEGSLIPGTEYIQAGSGKYKIQRLNSSEDSTDFVLWSSPITLGKINELPGPSNGKYGFKPGGSDLSDLVITRSSDTLKIGLGYLASGDSIETIAFTGIANNGNVYQNVKNDTLQPAINLLGNPYPGSINVGQFIQKNSKVLDRVVYLRAPKSKRSKFSSDELVAINDVGATGSGINDSGITLKTTEIGAATGFFTLALKSDTVLFDNTLRNTKKPTFSTLSSGPLKINLTLTAPDSFYSQTVCAFTTGATDAYDAGLDAYYIATGKGLGFYSMLNKSRLSIQSYAKVDSNKSMPLGLQTTKAGKYTFKSFEEKPLDYFSVYLVDKDSGKIYDLKKGSVSIQLDSIKTINQRFLLKIEKILPKITIVKNKVCLGDTAVFTIAQPSSKFKYQWIFDGKESKGDTLSTFRAIKSGKLVLRQTYSDNNSDETAETGVIIYNLPGKPRLQRNVVIISAGKGYKGYQWYRDNQIVTDSIRHSLSIVKNGSYFCVVSDSNKCYNHSDTTTLKKVEIEVVQNNLCPGEKSQVKVKNPESGFKYLWLIDNKNSQNDTNQTLYLTKAADIKLLMFHTGGYTDTSTSQKITFKTLPNKPKLSQSTGILDAGSGFSSYQWYKNNKVLNRDTSQTLLFPSSGEYHCLVKNADGCINRSDTIHIKKVSITTRINNPCDGDTAKFEITEIKKGFRYRWELDGKHVAGDTLSTYASTKGGNLKLIEYNALGFKDTALSVKITVRPLPIVPKISLADAKLHAGPGYQTYRWFKNTKALQNDSNQIHPLADTGSYRCIVTNKEACSVTSSIFRVKGVEITEIRNQVCEGDSTIFGVLQSKSGFRYRWIFNGTSQPTDTGFRINLKKSGSLRLLEYNAFGYKDTSKLFNSMVNPLPIAPNLFIANAEIDAGIGHSSYQWLKNGIAVSGAITQKYSIKDTGNYHCEVSNKFGCKMMSNVLEILPASIETVKNTVCGGDSTQFRIKNRKPGFIYQWYIDNTAMTPANDSQVFTTVSGAIKLRETNVYGYYHATDSTLAVVNPLPVPSNLVFKNGLLDAGSPFDGYIWYKNGKELQGKNNQFISPDGPAEYYAILSIKGCSAQSPSFKFEKVKIRVIKAKYCLGDSLDMQVLNPDTNFQYQWLNDGVAIPNEKTEKLAMAVEGKIQVIQWHPAGYRDTSSTELAERLVEPVKPKITRSQLLLNAGGPYSIYQWYKNAQLLSGETSQALTISSLGLFHCKVGNTFDCFTNSDTFNVESLFARDILKESNIRLMPNPTLNETYISIDRSGTSTIQLLDLQGKLLSSTQGASIDNMPLGMQNLPSGIYLIKVENEGKVFCFRVVKW